MGRVIIKSIKQSLITINAHPVLVDQRLVRMLKKPITGVKCIANGWLCDAMGESFDRKSKYFTEPIDGYLKVFKLTGIKAPNDERSVATGAK